MLFIKLDSLELFNNLNARIHQHRINTIMGYNAIKWDEPLIGSDETILCAIREEDFPILNDNEIPEDISISNSIYFPPKIFWNPQKYSGNPIITTFIGANDPKTAYPSYVWKDVDGFYYSVTDTSSNWIVSYKSDDGKEWEQQNIELSINAGEDGIGDPFVRKIGSTYYLFYNASTVGLNYRLKYAISSDPIGSYVKQGELFTTAQYNSQLGSNMDGVIITDVVKVGSVYHWFGVAMDQARSEIFRATSSSLTGTITAVEIIARSNDIDPSRALYQTPICIKTLWGWILTYTVGAYNGIAYQERNIRSSYSTESDPINFVHVNEVMLNPNPNSWEALRVYGHYFLKPIDDDSYQSVQKIDDKYAVYYSGHALDGSNHGVTGLAFFDCIPDLRHGSELITYETSKDEIIDGISGIIAWIEADDNCYFATVDNYIWQVGNKKNKNNSINGFNDCIYTENSFNSLPASKSIQNGFFSFGKGLGLLTSYTQFLIIKPTSLATQMYLCGTGDSAGTNGSVIANIILNTDGSFFTFFADGENYTIDETDVGIIEINTPYLITVTYQNGDAFSKIYLNGNLLETTNIIHGANNTGNIERNFSLGRSGDYNGFYFKGIILPYIHANRVLSESEMNIVTTYLLNKYL